MLSILSQLGASVISVLQTVFSDPDDLPARPPWPTGPPWFSRINGEHQRHYQSHVLDETTLCIVSNWLCVRLNFPGPAWDAWSEGKLDPKGPDCHGAVKLLEVGPECQCVLLQGEPGYGMKGEKGDGGAPGATVSGTQVLLLFWCLWCEQWWRCSVPCRDYTDPREYLAQPG